MSDTAQGRMEGDRDLVMTRVFDAPRALVFDAYTNPEHLPKWWGPQGFTITMIACDVRPGGQWRFIMHGPDGTDYQNRINYLEVTPPERLVYDLGDDVHDMAHVTVTFTDVGGKTELQMRMEFPSKEARDTAAEYAIDGGKSTLERLAAHLDTLQQSA